MSTENSALHPALITLSEQQRTFVIEHVKGGNNAAQAAIRAGYSVATAKQAAFKLLKNPKIQAAVVALSAKAEVMLQEVICTEIADAHLRVGLHLEDVLREVKRGVSFDVRKLLDAEGNPLPLHELDDDTASMIAGLELATEYDKEGNASTVVRRYKLADRKGFVDMGLKVLGGYKKDNDQAGAAQVNALANLLASMRRSALPVVHQVDDELV